MKTALVLEGGAMRGMFTAGVLDVFMEKKVGFDAVIGVSAGALFGVNFLSGQVGRVVRYNTRFNGMKGYMGLRPLLKEGNIIDTELAYEQVPKNWDPFDDETYKSSKVPFYAVVTNIRTGEPKYVRIHSVMEQMDTLRASGSMPFVSKPVALNDENLIEESGDAGNEYLDGAVADSIPFDYMLKQGYDRVVVILTKKAGYIKKPMSKWLAKSFYGKKYPRLAEKIINRHNMYNDQMKRLYELEKQGVAEIICTTEDIKINKIEKDPKKLELLYQEGRKCGLKWVQNKVTE